MSEINAVMFFNQLGRGSIDILTVFLSSRAFMIILLVVLGFLVYCYDKKHRKVILYSIILALVFHFFFTELLLKHTFIFRVRPYIVDSSIIPIGTLSVDSSFPSAHMASTAAVLTIFIYFYRNKKVIIASSLLLLLMAFARIHNGMHFPTDILVGTVLGIMYGLAAVLLIPKVNRKITP